MGIAGRKGRRMAAELWDLYDERGERTGQTIRRGEAIPPGLYHLGVHIWPINSRGEFLVQRRAPSVQWLPNRWSVTGGCAVSGEDARMAAMRELFEEIGYRAEAGELRRIAQLRRGNAFCGVFALHTDKPADTFTLQKEEVSAVAWKSPAQLRQMVAQNLLYNYGNDYFRMIFHYQSANA